MVSTQSAGKVLAATLALLTLFAPSQAWARGGRDDDRRHGGYHGRSHHRPYYVRHRYPSYGRVEVVLPFKYVTVVIGGRRYYHCDGVFYRKHGRQYVVVAPPSGIVVDAIPSARRTVIIDGATYYESGGVYYRSASEGYEVVSQPSVTVVEPAKIASRAPVQAADDVFTVNIPNKQGGYTAVPLKRSGEGFTGPQGEYYDAFPPVEQLREMYAK